MAEITEKITEEEAIPTRNLPEVLITDILTRLPVKSLLRFNCVCKTWCALITDPAFVKEHLNRSLASNSNLSLILGYYHHYFSVDLDACEQEAAVELDHPQEISLDSIYDYDLSNEVEGSCDISLGMYNSCLRNGVLGSCHGLLCISNSVVDMFLWNPSIRTHHRLPNAPIELVRSDFPSLVAHGLGYDPTTDDYKLIRIVQFVDDDQYSCDSDSSYSDPCESDVKVFSLSTNSWRRIRDMPYRIYYGGFGVFANYALHWVAGRDLEPDNFIISFDLQDEEFREVPLPDFLDNYSYMYVGVLGGQLCFLCRISSRFEVWVMKDYGVRDSWVKLFTIEQPEVISSLGHARPLCYSKNGEVIFNKSDGPLLLYDPRSGRVRTLRIPGAPDRMKAEVYIGSLIPLNAQDGIEQPGKKKKQKKG
ncbi:F-box protein CPR1-like [Macadamia integrifolia]|uniref:F-box protein CPR1-like n=1 Tax=Macadamia integrifolia TaxID=60698 RepID=UPI001C4F8259|nr:F-box protein CPR1-like [Macadamia integrifolia]